MGGGTNRCALRHAVAVRPHCRLTLTAPGDEARHGEWIFVVSPHCMHMAHSVAFPVLAF